MTIAGSTYRSFVLAMAATVSMSTVAHAGDTGFARSTAQAHGSASSMQMAAQAHVSAAPSAGTPRGFMPGAGQSDDLDNSTQFQRLAGASALAVVGVITLDAVGGFSRNLVSVGTVGSIPIYGKAIQNIPVCGAGLPVYGSFIGAIPLIGNAAAAATVPTTLGQVPFLGPVVSGIPLAGPIIAGPPNPIVVGAVAVDTYLIPKCNPCGFTPSSQFTNTDFNSPPRLRHYVNYVAPLTYTHPPIYAPATLNTGQLPNTGSPLLVADGGVVSIPN